MRELRSKNVLITGGLGFIGSNIAQRCVSLGAKVTIYDACLDPYGWNFANIKEIKDKVNFVRGDTRNFSLLKKHIQGKHIIFDCAAQISHMISVKEPLLDVDITVRGGLNVLEAARQLNSSARLVYASTRGVIGKMLHRPVDESHPTNPVDVNVINKLAVEKYYMLYHRVHQMKTSAVRINNAYGERGQMRHGDYGIVNWFIRKAMLGEQITINGPGTQTRDYLHISDVVDAMLLAAVKKEAIGQVFNIGSGTETKFIGMCNMILKATGSRMKIAHGLWPKDRKAIEIGNIVFSSKKILDMLGWQPKVSLEDGLRRTVDFYRKRKEAYF